VLSVEKDRENAAKLRIAEEENKSRLQELAESRRLERLREILSPSTMKNNDDDDDIINEIIISTDKNPGKSIRDELDYIIQNLDEDEEMVYKICSKKKDPRPDSWRAIAELSCTSSINNVILAYPEVSKNSNGETISSGGIETRIRRWKIDYKKELKTGELVNVTYGGSVSNLGDAIDKELRIRILDHVAKGVPINDIILKALAIKLLKENNKEHLLMENGGPMRRMGHHHNHTIVRTSILFTFMLTVPPSQQQLKITVTMVAAKKPP